MNAIKRLIMIVGLFFTFNTFAVEFRIPPYEVKKLSNGMTVYLMEKHDVPLVAIKVVIKTGALSDKQQGGLASFTANSLTLGSNKFDKTAIDQSFDFYGATISSWAGLEASYLAADFASRNQSSLLPIVADSLIAPKFDEIELDKYQKRSLDRLRQVKESPRNVITNYFRSMLYENGGYANVVTGTHQTFSLLTKNDVVGFYKTNYRPENTTLIVVGDFQSQTMFDEINTLFGRWRNDGAIGPKIETGKIEPQKAQVWLVNKSDAKETTFVFGGKGVPRNDPDYTALNVINTVLGGRFTSWLNDELRVNSGLTYGANSSFVGMKDSGTFGVSSFTATEKTEATLALAMKTYERLWSKGIDAKTLASAKAYVKGQFPPKFQTNSELASLLSDMVVYDFGREQVDNFTRDIDRLDVDKAKELIRKHFPRENLQMVLVGKSEQIKDIAAKYGEVKNLDITQDGFK